MGAIRHVPSTLTRIAGLLLVTLAGAGAIMFGLNGVGAPHPAHARCDAAARQPVPGRRIPRASSAKPSIVATGKVSAARSDVACASPPTTGGPSTKAE
jgi:hypothetical protein